MMSHLTSYNYLKEIFTQQIPLIDVRAPCEFISGKIPNSINLPLLENDERVAVGTCYKQHGREQAIRLGYKLVCGETKEERVAQWMAFMRDNPQAKLFCFRGGLRSQTSRDWIQEKKERIEIIAGGYKSIRRFFLDYLEQLGDRKFIIVSGKTGSGKTDFLQQFSTQMIDLEGLASHRGSAFGALDSQPSQTTFENDLAYAALQLEKAPFIVMEHESRMIGQIKVPEVIFNVLKTAPLVHLQVSFEERVERIKRDYVLFKLDGYKQDFTALRSFLVSSLEKISQRLGGSRLKDCHNLLSSALEQHEKSGVIDGHDAWITYLLKNYYDPLYDKSLEKNRERICLIGNSDELKEALPQMVKTL